MESRYNPDVLTCLANLSNDEVFTPPAVVNSMLDMLPAELWSDSKATFLDPVSKSGVFLREIAKRLMVGLEAEIPDAQMRVDHILTKQVFGIAITELTSMLSRRSLYCSKKANGELSVCKAFDSEEGNVLFTPMRHTWHNGKCRFCGASQEVYDRVDDLESHAYQFIHTNNPEELFNNMKFDVIIGNPPYQLNVGVEQESYAIPLYHKFIQQAKKLTPKYLSMIVPSRWFAGGRGLNDFRDEMLNDDRIRIIHDFPDASDCFPSVEIKGGVCYFLWKSDDKGLCTVYTHDKDSIVDYMTRPLLEHNVDTFIRFNSAIPILKKIQEFSEGVFSQYVSPQTPFGIISSFKNYKQTSFDNSIKLYANKNVGYIKPEYVERNEAWVSGYKIYIAKASEGKGSFPNAIIAKPFVGEPNSCCTQTYLHIGPFKDEQTACCVRDYMKTKFFRFMVMLKKNTQDAMRGVYDLVPIQDFAQEWTDEKLYAKYGLSDEEIAFVESMIRPME
ncbi:MAG: Eco57I restriction-modification methylase domain-containing protein [Rikenellaceae bacterium]